MHYKEDDETIISAFCPLSDSSRVRMSPSLTSPFTLTNAATDEFDLDLKFRGNKSKLKSLIRARSLGYTDPGFRFCQEL